MVAVDPGVIARRVMSLTGVYHLRAELSLEETIEGLARHAPYSVVVCDASVSNANELLVKIAETFEKVSSSLKKSVDGEGGLTNGDVFAWPLCLVVTLKLPFKTKGSIDRNMEKVNKDLPEYLRRIALLGSLSGEDICGGDVGVGHKICYLFANSASEQTLVAVFSKK